MILSQNVKLQLHPQASCSGTTIRARSSLVPHANYSARVWFHVSSVKRAGFLLESESLFDLKLKLAIS